MISNVELCPQAKCKGVSSSSVFALTSVPFSINNLAISIWLFLQAKCKGVRREYVNASVLTPFSINTIFH
ncbi:hypothetical protein M0811_10232 [Anaeramoeba ignava]|uniref:Uncharacterized protein n=1 Tax=Anaeramoeba ignava TaxID=1746090 RepID=A0A9Q0LFE8_ANAIG|nr:hypothetical protein M0811_10232 [Anaeramoeba ignava]